MLHQTEPKTGGHVLELEVGGVPTRILESCHSTWMFQPERMRFRRVPLGTSIAIPSEDDWHPYYRMEVDLSTGVFAVALNLEGTRLLRSWLHIEPCEHCQTQDETGEVSLSPVRY